MKIDTERFTKEPSHDLLFEIANMIAKNSNEENPIDVVVAVKTTKGATMFSNKSMKVNEKLSLLTTVICTVLEQNYSHLSIESRAEMVKSFCMNTMKYC